MDESFNSIQKEKAIFICKGYTDSSRFKLDCFTAKADVLVLSAYFTDSTIATLHGLYQQYYDTSILQTQGYYQSNQKQGVWQDWNEEGQKTDSAFYDKGVRLRYARYNYFSNPDKKSSSIYSYELMDSLANTLNTYFYSDSGTLSGQVKFIGETGVWTHINKDGFTLDTVHTRVQTEAAFPGGNMAWARYLEKALGSFNPAENGAPKGKWQVIVKFIVDKDGTISDIQPETRFGHKMEEMVVRVIANGPKWLPANQYGKPIKAYRRQPVTFLVEEQ